MRFSNFICSLALVATTPALAQYSAEDYDYNLAVRDALAGKIAWNPFFGDIRKGILGNPDKVKNKKKGGDDADKDDSDEDSSSSDTDKDEDKSKSKEKKKKSKDKRAVERALYIRDLMDDFLEERSLDDYEFDLE